MKLLPFVLSRKALTDLEEIWLYTARNWSIDQADRYYALVLDEVKYICRNTAAGKGFEHIRKGYRASKVKSHLIFYRVNDNTVEIIRILHERMDINERLMDDSTDS